MKDSDINQLISLTDRLENIIAAIPSQKEWLRTNDVAEYLNISTSQVHVLKNEGILPFSKLHGSLYFKKSDIDRLLEDKMNT